MVIWPKYHIFARIILPTDFSLQICCISSHSMAYFHWQIQWFKGLSVSYQSVIKSNGMILLSVWRKLNEKEKCRHVNFILSMCMQHRSRQRSYLSQGTREGESYTNCVWRGTIPHPYRFNNKKLVKYSCSMFKQPLSAAQKAYCISK